MTEALTPEPQRTLATAIPDAVAIIVVGIFAIQGMLSTTEALSWIVAILMGRAIPRPGGKPGGGSGLMALLFLPLTLVTRRYG